MTSQRLDCTVSPAQGFHFTLQIDNIPTLERKSTSKCSQYLLYSLPRDVFVDPYELAQRQHDNIGPQFKIWGETDLELPTSAVSEGSVALLGPVESEIAVDLPFHARYPVPSVNDTHVTLKLKEPSLLTICDSEGHRKTKPTKYHEFFAPYDFPFDSKVITRVESCNSGEGLIFKVPAGNQNHLAFVEPLTMLSVFVAACYMARAFWKTAHRFGRIHRVKTD